MKPLNKHFAPKSVMPEKVIQFGEGNFLRAFQLQWFCCRRTAHRQGYGRLVERSGLSVSC